MTFKFVRVSSTSLAFVKRFDGVVNYQWYLKNIFDLVAT